MNTVNSMKGLLVSQHLFGFIDKAQVKAKIVSAYAKFVDGLLPAAVFFGLLAVVCSGVLSYRFMAAVILYCTGIYEVSLVDLM